MTIGDCCRLAFRPGRTDLAICAAAPQQVTQVHDIPSTQFAGLLRGRRDRLALPGLLFLLDALQKVVAVA